MATGVVESSNHPVEHLYQSDLSDWVELNENNQLLPGDTRAGLWRVDRNLWYIQLGLYGIFKEHYSHTVGKIKFSYFGNHPVRGYLSGVLGGNSDNQFPCTARVSSANGNITVVTPILRVTDSDGKTWNADGTIGYVFIQGLIFRDESATATN